uniref:Putative cytochrome P450 protein n=1 Tax=Linum usitatissimum TaxID=4006 RepID=I6XNC3_LINUS|nr:putative cytochrome P450 protein [Linum usitatissimum]
MMIMSAAATLAASLLGYLCWNLVYAFWVSPLAAYYKLRRNGFGGPTPSFPLGNIKEMRTIAKLTVSSSSSGGGCGGGGGISHDIHSNVFPYFSQWQNSHGKVFVYWLGTEPFMYIADPEFLKEMSAGVMGKSWGKPRVFKQDREPMFGNGLVMVEGDDWVRHRHVITPAFTPSNLKAMSSLMVESTTRMLDEWATLISSGVPEIEVESHITATAGEIIAKTSFGVGYNESGRMVVEKLRAMQLTLFNSNRYVGVPYSKIMCPRKTLDAKKLGKEIDSLLLSIISTRKNSLNTTTNNNKDLLGLLLQENHADGRLGKTLTTRELVDECKTFFFGGHETTALAISWTLMLLAKHPEWQDELRKEIKEVSGDKTRVDFAMLSSLKKMGWVMNEVLRLYSPAPNVQRQAKEDIKVNGRTIPKGTNMWIDVVAMHHDRTLWGDDVYEFKPERFKADPLYGGCKHKMGFMPFGFGGRMCVGRNLTMMEYKIVLSLILTRFSFSLSPSYDHSPAIVLSLRPSHGVPLVLRPLA